jgi:hypothetical protein
MILNSMTIRKQAIKAFSDNSQSIFVMNISIRQSSSTIKWLAILVHIPVVAGIRTKKAKVTEKLCTELDNSSKAGE